MYGIALVAVSLSISNLVLYAVGLGLLVDELTFLCINGKTHKDNYSAKSLVGTIALMMLAYLFREQLFGII